MKEEILGLSVIEEFVIKCGDCGAELANLVISETNNQREARGLKPIFSIYKITNCYKCSGNSFTTKTFEGSSSISPAKDFFDLDEIDTEKNGNVISSILKVIKR